jgi:predicted PhzF superfamily epimerase YddE/YHI9
MGPLRYTRDVAAEEKATDLQARMFFPGPSSLIEDPATGSATVAAAALLADLSPERDGELKLRSGRRRHGQAKPVADPHPNAKCRPHRVNVRVRDDTYLG